MKRNTLTTAVMAGLTGMAGMMSVANAVNVNPDGLGQVLLYPYYTARGGNDTLISVVNTTSEGKAVKVRFIEALNSREVLDFNLYLSPFDVWTAAVTQIDSGGDLVPGILIGDSSCTAPYLYDRDFDGPDVFPAGFPDGEQLFLDFQFNADEVPSAGFVGTIDGGPSGIERAASGYIEMIEMGTLDETLSAAAWATHDETGKPADCASLNALWSTLDEPSPGVAPDDPEAGDPGFWNEEQFPGVADATWGLISSGGGVFGGASIINVLNGTMFSYNATAIDSFWAVDPADPASGINHTNPGDLFPSLASGDNLTSNVFSSNSPNSVQSITWDGNPFALNASLTFATVMNEYNLNSEVAARTEWVLTFPTKSFHVDSAPGGRITGAADPIKPFTDLWTVDDPDSCDKQSFKFWNREEFTPGPGSGRPGGGAGVSPPPPPGPVTEDPEFQLCREANVIRFSNDGSQPAATEILGEPLRDDGAGGVGTLSYTNIDLPSDEAQLFKSGWVRFDFTGFSSVPASDGTTTVTGLPVIGFGVNTFTNGQLPGGVLSNYGGTFEHRGTRE